MRVKFWHYPATTPEGAVLDVVTGEDSGARLNLEPGVRISDEPPHWMACVTGRLPDGSMAGCTVYFEDDAERQRFMRHPDVSFDPY